MSLPQQLLVQSCSAVLWAVLRPCTAWIGTKQDKNRLQCTARSGAASTAAAWTQLLLSGALQTFMSECAASFCLSSTVSVAHKEDLRTLQCAGRHLCSALTAACCSSSQYARASQLLLLLFAPLSSEFVQCRPIFVCESYFSLCWLKDYQSAAVVFTQSCLVLCSAVFGCTALSV